MARKKKEDCQGLEERGVGSTAHRGSIYVPQKDTHALVEFWETQIKWKRALQPPGVSISAPNQSECFAYDFPLKTHMSTKSARVICL